MRRGDVGPMGVVALVLVLGLQAVAVGQLLHGWRGALLVAILVCVSRGALVVSLCARGARCPYRRTRGRGGRFGPAGGRRWSAGNRAHDAAGPARGVHRPSLGGIVTGVLVGLAAGVAVAVLVRHCVRRLGGVTGDVMGAAIETALTVLLVGAVL